MLDWPERKNHHLIPISTDYHARARFGAMAPRLCAMTAARGVVQQLRPCLLQSPFRTSARYASSSSSSSSISSSSSSSTSTTLDDLHRLLRTVTASYPHDQTLRMPTRLAPRQTWVELTQSRLRESGGSSAAGAGAGQGQGQQRAESALSESMLAPKPMSDSYVEMYLPFSSSPSLVEKYIATSGLVRLGMLFQDLDTLAGACSYQHVLGAQPREGDFSNPVYIVTASVDRLDMLEPLYPGCDYRLAGQVIYTGSSSLEVLVTVDEIESSSLTKEGESPRTLKTCLTGRFTMAARNASSKRAQRIPPLQLNTDAERALFSVGEELKARKKEHSQQSLERRPPTQGESALLHRQHLEDELAFARLGAGGAGVDMDVQVGDGELRATYVPVPVSATVLTSSTHMHPSHRNVHAKVFGGFLMRQAYELGWMCCALFKGGSSQADQPHTPHNHSTSGSDALPPIPVRFLALDTLSFHAPVEIGSMLSLTARVDYSEIMGMESEGSGEDVDGDGIKEAVAAVSVVAEVTNIATGQTQRTNTFRFSFALSDTSASPVSSPPSNTHPNGQSQRPRRRVSPRSYAEAMEWIDGRRRVAAGREVRRGLA
ncbi:unnamed protein product [Tilletia controversa]|nr:hypothetical protein CF328_g6389 [Tilletia controversa]CAD6930900.1 unnamed protein product [Tilletia controversa]